MYTSPKVYKVMSVILLIIDCLSALSLISTAIWLSVFSAGAELSYVIPDFVSAFSTAISILIYALIPVLLFFAYMKFSSMYTFGNLINREKAGDTTPFRTRGFLNMPAGGYQKFGYAIFLIEFILVIIAVAIMIISKSVETKCFISVPLIPIAILAVSLFLTYVTYYVKYKTFGDILSIAKNKNSEITALQRESLKCCKTGMLRGYCVFMFVMCIIDIITTIVGAFLIFRFVTPIFDGAVFISVLLVLGLVFICAANVAAYAITGCYFDNLALMSERLMIKYNLINRKDNVEN